MSRDRAKKPAASLPAAPEPPVPETDEWGGPVEVEAATIPEVHLRGEIRDLGAPEEEAVRAMFDRYGDDLTRRLVDDAHILKVLVRTDIEPHRRIFRMRRDTLGDLAVYDPVFLGRPVAQLGRKGARLTLEGGALIAPYATRRTVFLNEKGEQLFLYGRHLFGMSMVRVEGRPETGDEVLVFREATEDDPPRYLGIGIADRALRSIMRRAARGDEREVMVRNRLDLGLYLRAQQEVPE